MVRRTHGTGETKADAARKVETVSPDDLKAGSNRSGFANDHLLSFCERFERLSEEIGALTEDRKEVMAEAKSMGFDTKILRTAIRRRAMNSADRQKGDALLELYESALDEASKRQVQKSKDEGE